MQNVLLSLLLLLTMQGNLFANDTHRLVELEPKRFTIPTSVPEKNVKILVSNKEWLDENGNLVFELKGRLLKEPINVVSLPDDQGDELHRLIRRYIIALQKKDYEALLALYRPEDREAMAKQISDPKIQDLLENQYPHTTIYAPTLLIEHGNDVLLFSKMQIGEEADRAGYPFVTISSNNGKLQLAKGRISFKLAYLELGLRKNVLREENLKSATRE